MFVPNNDYEILTPLGFRSFLGMHVITRETMRVFADGVCILEGSPLHRVLTPAGYVTLEEIELSTVIITNTGYCVVDRIETGNLQPLFDPIDVDHPDQAFFTNDLISHNCSFQGSANTLISAKKLNQMHYLTPVDDRGDLKIYVKPIRADETQPAHIYVATADVSQGQEQDYSVLSIFDVSVSPFRQVAVYRRNDLAPQLFAPMIKDLAEYYCQAFVLIEVNDVGMTVADMLHAELEYENILYVRTHPKRGQMLAGGFHQKSKLGLKMTQATKRVGCSALRAMIEKDQLFISDFQTIRELTTFVAKPGGMNWEAEVGNHDDCVMTLVLLGWLSVQQGFDNYVGLSMRKMLANQYEPVTLDAPPIGIIDANAEDERPTFDDNALWYRDPRSPDPESWL